MLTPTAERAVRMLDHESPIVQDELARRVMRELAAKQREAMACAAPPATPRAER